MYRRKPVYQFDNKTSTGFDKIPNNSIVIVNDYDGESRQFIKNDPTGLAGVGSTITDMIGSKLVKDDQTIAKKDTQLITDTKFSGYGYTKDVLKSKRFQETDTPNVMLDVVSEPIRFTKGLVERLGEELVTDGGLYTFDNYSGTVVENDKVIAVDDGSYSRVIINNILSIGSSYKITFNALSEGNSTTENKMNFYLDTSSVVRTQIFRASTNEKFTLVFTATTNDIAFGFDGAFTDIYDNISVKEIQSIHYPNAPFSDTSDELLDYSVNTVETQQDHKKGDIVHVGNGVELVTNGTFDENTDGWESDSSTDTTETSAIERTDDGHLKITSNSEDNGHATTTCNFKAGVTYKLEIEIISCNANDYIRLGYTNDKTKSYLINIAKGLSDGKHTIVFTAEYNATYLMILGRNDVEELIVDNISVTPIEQTYQATQDSTQGYLVTSDKYVPIDFISRMDLQFIGESGKYYTMKGYHNFMAGASVQEVAEAYGFTDKGKGLFEVSGLECIGSDGVETIYSGEITCLSWRPRLNAKQHDKAHNPLGSLSDSDGKRWYEVDNQNTYDVLAKDTEYVSGIDDGELYDKLKVAGNNGFIFRNQLAIKPNLHDLKQKKTNEVISVSEMSEESNSVEFVMHNTKTDWNENNYKFNIANGVDMLNEVLGINIPIVSTTHSISEYVNDSQITVLNATKNKPLKFSETNSVYAHTLYFTDAEGATDDVIIIVVHKKHSQMTTQGI